MSTNKKQDVWCWEFAKIDWKQSRSIHQDHVTCLLPALCADGPLLLKHTAVKPPWRDFSTVLQIFFPFFFLLITERAVWEVTSEQSFLWFHLSDLVLRPVFIPSTRNNTLLWTLTYTRILSLSLSKPFMLFITSCLLTRLKQLSERLSGVKLEKLNWVNNKKM